MKKTLLTLTGLCSIMLYSCENPGEKRFMGNWKNRQHDSIEVNIKKEGDNILVSTLVMGKLSGQLSYKYKGNSLTNISPELKKAGFADDISYVASSGHLSWEGLEWEKVQTDHSNP